MSLALRARAALRTPLSLAQRRTPSAWAFYSTDGTPASGNPIPDSQSTTKTESAAASTSAHGTSPKSQKSTSNVASFMTPEFTSEIGSLVGTPAPAPTNAGEAKPQGPPQPPPDGYAPPRPRASNNPVAYDAEKSEMIVPPLYFLHVKSNRNNVIMTLAREGGHILSWWSGGRVGFKGRNEGGYEAGYQCTMQMFRRLQEEAQENKHMRVHVLFNGFGQGREAFISSLKSSEGDNVRHLIGMLTDKTPIKIGGTKAKKARRL